jgi:dCMP deaminase
MVEQITSVRSVLKIRRRESVRCTYPSKLPLSVRSAGVGIPVPLVLRENVLLPHVITQQIFMTKNCGMTEQEYFMQIADATKLRSGFTRRQVGAVYVLDKRVVSTGYNQAPSGVKHCDIDGCTIINDHCIRAIHAELNGILNATRAGQTLRGSDVYVTSKPCIRCLMSMRNAGIVRIFYREPYECSEEERGIYTELSRYFFFEQV